MNGFVFETSEEVEDPTAFVRTLEALERFAKKTYKTNLSKIFCNLKELFQLFQDLNCQVMPLMHMIKKLLPLK